MPRSAATTRFTLRNMGNSIRFDGSDDAVTTAYVPNTTAFSVAFWTKLTAIGSNLRYVDWQDGGPEDGFTIVQNTNSRKLNFQVANGASMQVNIASKDLNRGEWTFIVCTYEVNNAKIYHNAVNTGTDTGVTMTAAAATLTLGKRATGAANFATMWMDDFMMFERVLTLPEIEALYYQGTVPSGIALWYKFDEGTLENSGVRSEAIDSAGSNDGTIEGLGETYRYRRGTAIAERPYPRQKSEALSFSGTTDNVNCGNDASITDFTTTNAITLEAMVMYRTLANVLPRIEASGPNYTCLMGDSTNAKYKQFALEVTNEAETSVHEYWGDTKLNPLTWYHLVATFDGTTKQGRIYVNGKEDNTDEIRATGAEWTGNLFATSSDFILLNSDGLDRVFDGIVDYANVYNRALTATEVYDRYTKGTRITSGLVAEWKATEGSGTSVADTSGEGNTGIITGATWKTINHARSTAGTRTVVS